MNYYKAVIQYRGTAYSGWQKQPDQKTIQGEIEKVLSQISNTNDIQVIGSGRTDTGVHAFGQVVRLATPKKFSCETLLRALNGLINDDIRILEIEDSSEDFQPVFSAKKKTYEYYFSLDENKPPFFIDLITYLNKDLDLELMKKAASVFVGKHDFQNFYTTGTPVKSTIREIYSCEVLKVENSHYFGPASDLYKLKITGNGFLKQMVRLIMASIWSVGEGKVGLKQLEESFDRKLKDKLAPTAPPQGLYLLEVFY